MSSHFRESWQVYFVERNIGILSSVVEDMGAAVCMHAGCWQARLAEADWRACFSDYTQAIACRVQQTSIV